LDRYVLRERFSPPLRPLRFDDFVVVIINDDYARFPRFLLNQPKREKEREKERESNRMNEEINNPHADIAHRWKKERERTEAEAESASIGGK